MMDFIWLLLGILTGAAAIFLWKYQQRFKLNWLAWGGLVNGIILILFSIAWAAGAVLEGVPRAASMGLLLFGMSGIVTLTFTFRYIHTKLEKIAVSDALQSPVVRKIPVQKTPGKSIGKEPVQTGFVGKAIPYLAYLSLAAAFIFTMVSEGKDYEAMVKAKYKDATLVKISDDPVVFQLGEKKDGKGNYIVISEGQGYGGPLVIGVRIMDDEKIHEVVLLDNRETPAFRDKVEDANFPAQFKEKNVTDNFITGDDIDIVSGATISTMAATEAIRKAAHIAAAQYFKKSITWEKEPWHFGVGELLVFGIFSLAFFPKIYSKKPWQYVYMAATVAIIGFYLNAAISIGSLSGLAMGFIPGVKTHLIWWVLVVGTVATILITGKNVYCFRICPFYGVQYILGKVGGGTLKPSAAILKRSKSVANFLLWLSLMMIFLSSNPGLGSYEPFAMMFSLNGVGVQWFLLPLALIGSFFMSTFWCRFFCPCGRALTTLRQFRQKIRNSMQTGMPK
jgi:Na+-translocating ferredoxin:NAD+ oxidoreductase RnfG subunit